MFSPTNKKPVSFFFFLYKNGCECVPVPVKRVLCFFFLHVCLYAWCTETRNDHFPTLFIYFFFVSKDKKIQTKKRKKKYTEKKGQLRSRERERERERITTSVDTETTTNVKKKKWRACEG